jgi:hypothetical protein
MITARIEAESSYDGGVYGQPTACLMPRIAVYSCRMCYLLARSASVRNLTPL